MSDLKSQVLNTLKQASISEEILEEGGIYLVEITDERTRTILKEFTDFDSKCQLLSVAATIGVWAIQAVEPTIATAETQRELSRIVGELKKGITDAQKDLQRTLADAQDVVKQMQQRAEHIVALTEERKKQPYYAGSTFEQRIADFLDKFAEHRHDPSPRYTGTKSQVGGKVGDIVYSMYVDGRSIQIALELKNTESTRSGKSAYFLDQLENAMHNRQCQYGIVVLCLEKNSDNGKPRFQYLQMYPDNKFVVLVDEQVVFPIALEAALYLIYQREKSIMERRQREVDVSRIQNAILKAHQVVELFKSLKTSLSNLIESAKEIRKSVDQMEKQVENAMKEVQEEIQKAIPTPQDTG